MEPCPLDLPFCTEDHSDLEIRLRNLACLNMNDASILNKAADVVARIYRETQQASSVAD